MFVRGRDNSEHNHPYLKPRVNIQLENSALFAKMEAFAKWVKTPEEKKSLESRQKQGLENVLVKFPNADKSKFEAQVYFENEKDHTGKAEIYFKKGQGFLSSVFGSYSKYWNPEMKAAMENRAGSFRSCCQSAAHLCQFQR